MQTFNRTIIMLDYTANTQAYAKNCENKARPKMHCNGKCQMMKKLQQEEKKDQQNPDRKMENKNEITLSSKSFFNTPSFVTTQITLTYAVLSCGKELKMPRSIFHPPGA
jgi:hypothetical protein